MPWVAGFGRPAGVYRPFIARMGPGCPGLSGAGPQLFDICCGKWVKHAESQAIRKHLPGTVCR